MGSTHEPDTDFEVVHDSLGYLLWLMSNKWQAQQRAALKPFGLTHVQFVLLASLVYAPSNQHLNQIQLAERAQTDPMMTSQVLRKLEDKDLIQRTSSTKDKRAVSLRATSKGVELVHRAIEVVEAVDREFFGVLETDVKSFATMLQKLIQRPNNTLNKAKEK